MRDRASGRPVLDGADDRGENGAGDAATGDLAYDAADIGRRGAIGQQRNQHAEKLPAGTAADGARDGISKRAEIDVLGRAPATLPPMAPLTIWMIRLMSIPDMTRHSRDPV